MMDAYSVVPNRAERRRHRNEKYRLGKVGHIETKLDKYKNFLSKKIAFKQFVRKRGK